MMDYLVEVLKCFDFFFLTSEGGGAGGGGEGRSGAAGSHRGLKL